MLVHVGYISFMEPSKEELLQLGGTLITCYNLYGIFSDAPAKKEDYMKMSTSKKFPLQFCATRWLEDVAVAERAILIWPDIQVFIAQICAGPKSKIPKSHSFTSLQGVPQDLLVPTKLQFFCTIAKVLHPFLEVFQRERPMLPFMAEYLYDILYTILDKFIKKSVTEKVTSMAKVAEVDVMEKENLLHAKEVDIRLAARKLITDLQKKKKVSGRQIFEYQNECQVFLQSLTVKLLERCPLQYPVVRNIVCLDPKLWSLVKLLLMLSYGQITSRKRIFYQQRYHSYQYGCWNIDCFPQSTWWNSKSWSPYRTVCHSRNAESV